MRETRFIAFFLGVAFLVLPLVATAGSQCMDLNDYVYDLGTQKPKESTPVLKVGQEAPEFILPAVGGGTISLLQYKGKKNVVISFVPAAWTPVCSAQWPGYNLMEDVFDKNEATLIGITVDNIPTLYAWTKLMSKEGRLWFPVLSDFYPHGQVALKYGVLRDNGTSERAIFIIDKKGIIRYIDIHNINKRPPLEDLIEALEKVHKGAR
ncbi:MAG TPA: redoxin domain-containing protein [Syntrophorhabdaceae bacterium]|jgi:peroxiredoxin (alkyl hydroperoxide reductase subunit C)